MGLNAIGNFARLLAIVATVLTLGCGDSPEKLLSSAKAHIAKSETNAAVIQLRNLLQKNANHAEARFLLGRLLLETGDPATAEKELQKALDLGFSNDLVVPPLTRSLVEQGQGKKVIAEFGKTQLGTPDANADLQTNVGNAHFAQRELDAAKTAYLSAVTFKPDYPRALVGQALVKIAEKDVPAAKALIETALKSNPKLLEALDVRASIAIAEGNNEAAVKDLEAILSIRPDTVKAHYGVVTLLLQMKKTDEAKAKHAAMKKAAPSHPLTTYLQAWVAYSEKNLQGARDAIALSLRSAPNYGPGLLLAGIIERDLKSYLQAEQHLVKALERAPGHSFARRLLVATYLDLKQPARAIEALAPLLTAQPEDPMVLELAATVYAQNQDYAQASKYLEKSASLKPADAKTRTRLAMTRMAAGETDRAFRDLESAAAADSTQYQADTLLVLGHLNRKDYDKSLEAIKRLEQKQPNNPVTHNLRGTVYLSKGDRALARKSFEKALEVGADFLPAIVNLARLDVQDKKFDAAKQRFLAFLEKSPKHTQALLAFAEILNSSNAPAAEVQSALERAVASNPTSVQARLALIGFHSRNKDFKKAAIAAQDASTAIADNATIIEAHARQLQAAGDLNQAVAAYTKLVNLTPSATAPLLALSDAQLALKDENGAVQSLRKALTITPDLLQAQLSLASINTKAERYEEALRIARDIKKQRPKVAAGYMLEGDIAYAQRKWEDAIGAYREGLKQAKEAQLVTRLHTTLVEAGRQPDADRTVEEWLKANPKDAFVRNHLAEQSLIKQDYATAVRQYRAIIDLGNTSPMVMNNLAWAAFSSGDPKAVEYAEKAYAISPDSPAIMDTLGWILAEKGDTKRSVELLQKAVSAAPQVHDIRLHLAKALVKAGQKDAAKGELQTIAKAGDKFRNQDEVRKLLAAL